MASRVMAALFDARPKAKYLACRHEWAVGLLMNHLPSWVQDKVLTSL